MSTSPSTCSFDITDFAHGTGDRGMKTTGPVVAAETEYQTGQAYGDAVNPYRQKSQDRQQEQAITIAGKAVDLATDLEPEDKQVKPKHAWTEINMDIGQSTFADTINNEDVVVRIVEKMVQEKNIEKPILGNIVKHICLPSKEPTKKPSPEQSRPYCGPSFIKVNGKWVNLNKRPCILVRLRERMARAFRRLNRWYDEAALDLVTYLAQRQANQKRDEGLRQQ